MFMLVPIREKSLYMYEHHHTGMGPHNHMVIYFDTIQVLLNIGPHIV